MSDTQWAEQLLQRFVLPLVHGAALQVGAPLGRRGVKRLLSAIAAGLDGTPVAQELAQARQLRLRALLPAASVPRLADDRAAALLIIAVHDLLFLHHPAAARLSQRQTELLRGFALQLGARAAAHLPTAATALSPSASAANPTNGPTERPDRFGPATERLLGRHSLLAGLFSLWRADTRAQSFWGEREYRGVVPPSPRLRALLGRAPLVLPGRRQVSVLAELLAQPESAAVLLAVLAASPLTALLPPVGCPLLPALAEQARWLRVPTVARLVVARYLAKGGELAVAEAGGAVSGLLRQREPRIPSGDLMTLLCLVAHLHVCVALSEAALPTATAAGTARDSYALYAALQAHWPELAAPRDVRADPRLSAQLLCYVTTCRSVAGPALVREFDELCQGALAALPKEPDVAIRSEL